MNNVESDGNNYGKLRQFLAAIFVNVLSLSSGITWGWPSPIIPELRSSDPAIGNEPMSKEQISWIGGLMAIGGLLTIPFCGIIVERLGRKYFALLTGLPHIISWLLIIFARNYIYLYAARLAAGMGTAMTLFIVPLYVSEIASKEIRGVLGSLLMLAVHVGILFAYIAGAYLSYHLFAWLSLLFPLGFVAIFSLMPETPVYLVRRNRPLQAHKSLMFVRGNNRALVEQELSNLQTESKTSDNSSSAIKLHVLVNDRATRKGLLISFGLLGSQQLSGIFAMISYAETIFQRAASSLSATTATIIIALIQIIGSYASTMLMDRAGRRILALVSCIGMMISHGLVALFFCLQQRHYDVTCISWLPIVALSAYILFYCLGIGPVPYVVVSEVFKSDVSSLATTACFIFYWIVSFASIQMFTMAMQLVGVGGSFIMLASFCAASLVFVYCLLPETKGRERQDIINELAAILD